MPIDCQNCPLRERAIFHKMTREEVAAMRRFKAGELVVEPGTPILLEGSNSPQLYTVLEGLGVRSKHLPDGRRQVMNFVMPGDFLGLQAGLMGQMRHSVESATRMTLCVFDRSELWSFFRQNPERAYDLTWIAATEEHFLGETLLTVGQRTAEERIAWALVRLHERLQALGMARGGEVLFPFRQQDLADALGLSLVHTNKTLARLRRRQIATWRSKRLKILNFDALTEIAQIENGALPSRPIM